MAIEWNEEQLAKIKEAIDARMAKGEGSCPMCGVNAWSIGGGIVTLAIRSAPQVMRAVLGGPSYPTVALICNNCGNTVLLNAFNLGLSDYFGLKRAEPPAPIPKETPPAPAVPEAEPTKAEG